MGLMQYSISLVMFALFSIAIIGFATNFAADNNSVIDISDDPELVLLNSKITSNISSFREGSENTYKSIIESSIEQADTTPTGGQFAITPLNSIAPARNVLEIGYLKIFGTGKGFGIFLSSLLGILGFIFAMFIWKAWAGRSPD